MGSSKDCAPLYMRYAPGADDWPSRVVKGVTYADDIVDWRAFDPLRKWFKSGSDAMLCMLSENSGLRNPLLRASASVHS